MDDVSILLLCDAADMINCGFGTIQIPRTPPFIENSPKKCKFAPKLAYHVNERFCLALAVRFDWIAMMSSFPN